MPLEPSELYRDLLHHYQSAGLRAELLDRKSPEVVGKKAAIKIDGRTFDLVHPQGSVMPGIPDRKRFIKEVTETSTLMPFHYIMKGLGGRSQEDLNAEMKPEKKGVALKRTVDVHWKGGKLAGLLNGDAKLKTLILQSGTDKLAVKADPENDCVRIIFPWKISSTVTSKGIAIYKMETTFDDLPPIPTLDIVDGIADHVRSVYSSLGA